MRAYLQLPAAIYLLALGTVVNRAGTLIVPFLAIYLTQQLGLGAPFATQAVGLFGLGGIVASVWGGHLADALGRKVVMVGSLLGSAVLMVALGHVRDPAGVLVCIVALAVVGDMYRPASSSLIADLVPEHQRAHAYSLIYVAVNLGFSLAPVIGGALARHAFSWLFWGDAATSVLCAVFVALGIRTPPPTHHAQGTPQAVPPLGAALRHMRGNAAFMGFCAASFLLSLVYVQHISTLPIYARQQGVLEDVYGRAIAVNGMLIVIFQLPMAGFMTRFNKSNAMAVASVVVGIGFGLTMFVTDAWTLAGTVVVWTMGELMQAAFMQALVTSMAPETMRGRYLGVAQMTFPLANMVGSPLGGIIMAGVGASWLWGGCVVLGVVAAVLFLRVTRLMGPAAA